MKPHVKKVGVIIVSIFFLVLMMNFIVEQNSSKAENQKTLQKKSISEYFNLVLTGEKQVREVISADWLFETRGLAQDDARIVNYIRKYHLTPPSSRPYALDNPNVNPSEYSEQISKLLHLDNPNRKKGFFIEAGALDGEGWSNTLELERKLGWTGLLIEPNPFNLAKLRLKNRKAWISDVCLSFTDSPMKVPFNHRLRTNGIVWNHGMGMLEHSENNPLPRNPKFDEIMQPKDFVFAGFAECFPLFSILRAMNITVVDYFSLDIQGPELKVLEAFPFDLITIKVLSVEYVLVANGEQAISDLLKSKGYSVFSAGMDILAVHNDYKIYN